MMMKAKNLALPILRAEHLPFPAPDAIRFGFSESEWHFTLAGTVKIRQCLGLPPEICHQTSGRASPPAIRKGLYL